jgi:hypothetical protein
MSKKTVVAVGVAAVVAIALGIALGGAYASGRATVKPQKGILWAVVNSDGTFARHSKGIIQATRVTTGQYRVLARGDVRKCAYEATGGDDAQGIPPRTYADVAQHLFDDRGVFVETYDSTGTRVDSDFYLAVLC